MTNPFFLKCKICNGFYSSKISLERHQKRKHFIDNKPKRKYVTKIIKYIWCIKYNNLIDTTLINNKCTITDCDIYYCEKNNIWFNESKGV